MRIDNVVYLVITSWQGISLGAEHYYAKLKGDAYGEYTTYDLHKVMTEEDAEILRKKDDWRHYKAGSLTDRFNTKEEARESAILALPTAFPHAVALLEGNPAYVEPHYCLWVKNLAYIEKLNKVWKDATLLVNDDGTKMMALYRKFEKLLERACNQDKLEKYRR
jgi:hypothetical protein